MFLLISAVVIVASIKLVEMRHEAASVAALASRMGLQAQSGWLSTRVSWRDLTTTWRMRGGKRTRTGGLASPLRVFIDLPSRGRGVLSIQRDSQQPAGLACSGDSALAHRIANDATASAAIKTHLAASDRITIDPRGIHVMVQMEGEEQAEIAFQHAWALATTLLITIRG